MKIKNIFLQKNFLIPAILLIVIVSVATIVVLSSDSLDSSLLKNKQVAQVGSTCIPNPGVIIQNGNFELLLPNAVGGSSGYRLSNNTPTGDKEVCFFEGSNTSYVRDEVTSDPLSNNLIFLRYTRHSGEGIATSPWFNGHQSAGVVQYIGDLAPGTYNLTLKAKTQGQAPLVLYVGFSDGPILLNTITTQAGCTLSSSTVPWSALQNVKNSNFETCILGQLEYYTQVTVPAVNFLDSPQTYSQTITIDDTGLDYMYLLPFGPDPDWTVPAGTLLKPPGSMIVDDITLTPTVCPTPAVALATQAYGPVYYNQGGQPVNWGLGNFIALSQADSQPLTWSQYNSLASSTGGQGVVFQRPTDSTFVVTPLSPYTNYTLQDIQQMFSFSNTSITGMTTVYNQSGPFAYLDNFLRQSLFARLFLPKIARADISIPHYVVSYTCLNGLTNPVSTQTIPVDISVTKTFLDNTVSSTDRQIKYLVKVKNNSLTSGATGIVVKDLLPGGFQYVSHTLVGATGGSYNPQTGLLNIPFLSSSSFNSVDLTITVNIPIATCGLKTNTATLQSLNQTDSNSSNNSSSVSLDVVCLTTKTPTSTKK